MPSTLDTPKSRAVPRLRGFITASFLFLTSCTLIAERDTLPQDPIPLSGELLQFDITDGALENHFFRQGTVAAHLLTTSGKSPRLIVGFPADNTGIGMWFDDTPEDTKLGVVAGTKVDGIDRTDG